MDDFLAQNMLEGGDDGGSHADIVAALDRLTLAWTRERACADLFPFQERDVQLILTALDEQQRDHIPDTAETVEERLTADLYRLELDRIRYVLTEYLRTRLHKIEHYASYLLSTPEKQRCLSTDELEYARTFSEIGTTSMTDSFLGQLPVHLRDLLDESPVEGVSMLNAIPLQNYCIARVNHDVANVNVDAQEVIDLEQDDLIVIRYEAIQDLVEEGTLDII